ncbi:hypothetical protein EDD22DRAFT_291317 [Suillus occidentalis]|nr:hypothetical protein EDD22DRAFT_291317 [Suillus occidentalis]
MARELISLPVFAILLIACISLLARASPIPFYPINAIEDVALSDVVESSSYEIIVVDCRLYNLLERLFGAYAIKF